MPELTCKINGNINLDILKALAQKSSRVLVGYPAGRTHIDAVHAKQSDGRYKGGSQAGIETAELARELYFGSSRVPARPFLTDAIEEHRDELSKDIGAQLKREAEGTSANWNIVGTKAVGFIQEFVRGDYYKTNIPNSRSTIERKGSDVPLIDSADMINSTTYIVED